MDSNYFQGTLQLRNCSEKVLDYVERRMSEDNIGVAKRDFHKNGVDFKVSSNKFLMKLNNELPRVFVGKCTLTSRLFSKDSQTSREVHRMTLLFEEYCFKVGDVVEYKGERVKIVQVGAKVTAKNIETGRKLFIS
jgi:NMD protein affecting ribosome stability and mRNA decay